MAGGVLLPLSAVLLGSHRPLVTCFPHGRKETDGRDRDLVRDRLGQRSP
jgi:hypothetical protein